ncbi:MAG TPA: ribonuclease HII [Terriglobales bacterium]|nr:ribonuclease HII [Terriglobales bacterium]
MSKSHLKSAAASKADRVSAATAKLRLLKRLRCTLNFEQKAWAAGAQYVAGVDEVGRGSLFGPVVAAAVILCESDCENNDSARRIRGLRDSKLLPAEKREELALLIRERAVAWAIAAVDSARIDQINIYQASRLAMLHAVQQLAPAANHLLIDAVRLDCEIPQQPIIHGDALSRSIAAASIIAKVERDRMISAWDPVFPMYGLASNKGYCTPRHLAALREHGPSPLHRQSFSPVWNAPIPQEVLGFMLNDVAADVVVASEEEAEEELLAEVAET